MAHSYDGRTARAFRRAGARRLSTHDRSAKETRHIASNRVAACQARRASSCLRTPRTTQRLAYQSRRGSAEPLLTNFINWGAVWNIVQRCKNFGLSLEKAHAVRIQKHWGDIEVRHIV